MPESRIQNQVRALLSTNMETARSLLAALESLADPLQRAADVVLDTLLAGRKVLACGNGGSAADSAHFTAEIAGRFLAERRGNDSRRAL